MLPLKSPANPVTFHQSIRVFKPLFPVTFHQSSRILKLSSRFLSRAILLPFTKALEYQSYDFLSPFINASILSLILWSPELLFHLILPAAELCLILVPYQFSCKVLESINYLSHDSLKLHPSLPLPQVFQSPLFPYIFSFFSHSNSVIKFLSQSFIHFMIP